MSGNLDMADNALRFQWYSPVTDILLKRHSAGLHIIDQAGVLKDLTLRNVLALGCGTNFDPSVDNLYRLGYSSRYWKTGHIQDLYFGKVAREGRLDARYCMMLLPLNRPALPPLSNGACRYDPATNLFEIYNGAWNAH